MNWAQNKFLVGFTAVTVIGCGALGYLTWNAAKSFETAQEEYTKQAAEYNRLRSRPLFPNAENLKKLEAQTQTVNDVAVSLQQKLAALSFPLEPISPEQFQDRLRASVSAVMEKAQAAGMALPDKFYLGFDQYQSQPPKTEAAAPLWRQLKAVELAVNTLIESKVDAIAQINRTPLPEEGGAKAAPAPTRKATAATSAKAVGSQLVTKFPFEIQFTSDQIDFRRALNELVKSSKQFFIVRPILIQNQNEKQTPRVDPNAQAAANRAGNPPAPAAPAAQAPQQGQASVEPPLPEKDQRVLQYIVGTEKINVLLRLEMVVFDSPFPQ